MLEDLYRFLRYHKPDVRGFTDKTKKKLPSFFFTLTTLATCWKVYGEYWRILELLDPVEDLSVLFGQ
jgi:hypothetical protein